MYTKMVNYEKNVMFNIQTGIVEYPSPNGKLVHSKLGKKEKELLRYLLENIDNLLTKDDILQNVWKNRIVCENTASVALSNIRKLLKKADQDNHCLATISGSGYIFNPSKSGFKLENEGSC